MAGYKPAPLFTGRLEACPTLSGQAGSLPYELAISEVTMRTHLRTTWIASLLAAASIASSGCASTGKQNPLARLNLPSPWATVKASDDAEAPLPKKTAKDSRSSSKKAKDPADSQVSIDLLRGRGLEQSGELDKARKLYESLRQQHPDNVEVVHRLGVVADAQRRHAEAEGMFLYVLQREPRNAEALADLGYCYYLQGQLTKAESALAKAVKIEPTNPRYNNNLGLVVGNQGRFDEALAHFQKGGTEADAYYNLAFLYASRNQADKAKECFLAALNEDPTHGKSREALRSFEEYERLPKHMQEDELLAEGRVKYVPYVEDGDASVQRIRQVAADVPLPTSRDVSQATRALQQSSRGMLNRNMQSQRNESPIEIVDE
jgi:tetratricopeptide (TPR) repeat protein